MGTLLNALQTNDSFTENGMVTNSTSLNKCVDLFFEIGAMRGNDVNHLYNSFNQSFNSNPLITMKILFWVRDVRGGAGERQVFKDIIHHLANKQSDVLLKNLRLIPEYGRWDDLFALFGTPLEKNVLEFISETLKTDDSLIGKWLPRETNVTNKENAKIIRKFMGLSPKEYRKLIVSKSKTVETLLCAKKWDEIEYSKIPSKAMSNLMGAFNNNDSERFNEFLVSVQNGETTIHAGAIYPYVVINNMVNGDKTGANIQWNALPNYLEGNTERLLPLVDVSGSMSCPAGNNPNISCLNVAISLGLYISERNVGPFKDAFITFSENPKLEILSGDLFERYKTLSHSEWGMSTNLESVFKLVLSKAIKSNVSEDEMPTTIIILSDMEFNEANEDNYDLTAQEMIGKMYSDAGYKMPKIVYWNINARNSKNKPVQFNTLDCALVSGFSPSLLKNILSGADMTPYNIMMSVIDSDRYKDIKI